MNTHIYNTHTQGNRGVHVQRPYGREVMGRRDSSLVQYTRVESRGGHWGSRLKERDCQETGERLNRLGYPGLGLNYSQGKLTKQLRA